MEARRQADRQERLDVLRAYLEQRRAQRENDLRQIGVPEGAWHDVSVEIGAVIDPTVEPLEALALPIRCGGFDVVTEAIRGRRPTAHRVPRRAYEQWRGVGGPGDSPMGNRADWLAAEVWVIAQLLSALDTGDIQHVVNLSRLMMVCEANWRFGPRMSEIQGERIRTGRRARVVDADATDAAMATLAARSAELVANGHSAAQAARIIMSGPEWQRLELEGVRLPATTKALAKAITRHKLGHT